jgi:hypothetical protein
LCAHANQAGNVVWLSVGAVERHWSQTSKVSATDSLPTTVSRLDLLGRHVDEQPLDQPRPWVRSAGTWLCLGTAAQSLRKSTANTAAPRHGLLQPAAPLPGRSAGRATDRPLLRGSGHHASSCEEGPNPSSTEEYQLNPRNALSKPSGGVAPGAQHASGGAARHITSRFVKGRFST